MFWLVFCAKDMVLMPNPSISSVELASSTLSGTMATRGSVLTGLMVLITASANPALAQEATVTIEQIDTVVFPADGAAAAKAICTGLADGAVTRDQVGSALARLQRALAEAGETASATSYVRAFNNASAGIRGCNVQVTGPSEDNLWNY